MKLGIMQPYFFPYLGYFSLISATDRWIVFDTPQFIRHGWIERNRILNSSGDWQYIKVPLVKASQQTSIKEMYIRNSENWSNKILAQLTCYKRKAPNYFTVVDFLKDAFNKECNSISELNIHLLSQSCKYLGLKFNYQIFSSMDILFEESKMHAGSWALEIASAVGADTYLNPINGRGIFVKDEFVQRGISLKFLVNNLESYNQKNANFIQGLSILDSMMFLDKEELLYQVSNFELIDS